jgi:hypothetical protein
MGYEGYGKSMLKLLVWMMIRPAVDIQTRGSNLQNERRFVSCSYVVKSSTVSVVVCTSATGQAMP